MWLYTVDDNVLVSSLDGDFVWAKVRHVYHNLIHETRMKTISQQ